MKKICTKCGIEKSLEEFWRKTSTRDGYSPWCKSCTKEYRIKNRKKIATYKASYAAPYYLKNKEKWTISRFKNKNKIYKYRKGSAPYNTYAPQIGFAEDISRGENGEILAQCTYCGKTFIPTIKAIESRIRALDGRSSGECRLYCSEACKQACPSYHQQKYWKDSKPATSREVSAQFRQLVLKRDNWICQRCGAGIEAELHVHHIEGATQQPGISNDLENGITLCKACHKHVHSQNGCRYHELRCPNKDVLNVMPYMESGLRNNTEQCPQSNRNLTI